MKKKGKKRGAKKKVIMITAFLLVLINLIFVSSAELNGKSLNLSIEQKSALCLNESKHILQKLKNENFSILRVNDSLKQMEDLHNAQIILKEQKKPYDFSAAIPYCNEIKKIEKLAFISRDDLNALKKFYSESLEGLNKTLIDSMIADVEQEIANERYEKVNSLIDKTYKEIINEKAKFTTFNVFYENTTRSIGKFFNKNKHWILGILIFLILILVFYKKTISKWILKRKINKLELRKKTLKELIMGTQKSYFNEGSISEGTFNIKTKKLAELIRDIDRQIPLLQEELARLEWNKKEDKKKLPGSDENEEENNKFADKFKRSFKKLNMRRKRK